MATQWKCRQCDFEYCDGYSHHEQGAWAYCTKCGLNYDLKSTEGYWGFKVGEDVHVRVTGKHGKPQIIKIGMGEKVNVWEEFRKRLPEDIFNNFVKAGRVPEYDHKLVIPLELLICVKCKSHSMSTDMADGQQCPKCKCATITNGGEIIF